MKFSSADVIGKTLIAKRRIAAKSAPSDYAPIVRYFEVGEPIGVVQSYLAPKLGRTKLHWEFYGPGTSSYFVAHYDDAFDLSHLQNQFPQKEETFTGGVLRIGGALVGGYLGIKFLGLFINSLKK